MPPQHVQSGTLHRQWPYGRILGNPQERETYYGKKFTDRKELVAAINDYIDYYNNRRIQRKLHRMTPLEFHSAFNAAAWMHDLKNRVA